MVRYFDNPMLKQLFDTKGWNYQAGWEQCHLSIHCFWWCENDSSQYLSYENYTVPIVSSQSLQSVSTANPIGIAGDYSQRK